MVKRIVYGAASVWIALGTLLMVYTSLMAIRDPKLHLGFGIGRLMGARALIASLPLSACGFAGLTLLLRHRVTGPYLLALFSLTWTVCLGLDALRDFDAAVAGIAALYLLATVWSIHTARRWEHFSSDRAAIAAGSGSTR